MGEVPEMLTLREVVAGYGYGDVLRGVDLTVERGSITCIVGPNGAGKSTVLRAVSGLLRPRQGQITFEGDEIGGLLDSVGLREPDASDPYPEEIALPPVFEPLKIEAAQTA